MKKLILLIIIAAAVYLLWGNINKEGVKEKFQQLEQKGENLLHKGEKDVSNATRK
jgi:hypothetical protein